MFSIKIKELFQNIEQELMYLAPLKIKFEEKDNQMQLLFAYDVLESDAMAPKKLEKDEDFKNYIGDLLVELMSGNLEQEIIDETGTDDIKEPGI